MVYPIIELLDIVENCIIIQLPYGVGITMRKEINLREFSGGKGYEQNHKANGHGDNPDNRCYLLRQSAASHSNAYSNRHSPTNSHAGTYGN